MSNDDLKKRMKATNYNLAAIVLVGEFIDVPLRPLATYVKRVKAAFAEVSVC